ncbi:hypothetical protein F2Q68_00006706 [Brassica cretica]|uniref:Uncharacterized protein n=1 Tax=Brassica cretica TaxID=69181 RepID=A0A8S9JDH1_BRACR|nr:hypothetical protein F2Q68_00006706 [Brassica cretica]
MGTRLKLIFWTCVSILAFLSMSLIKFLVWVVDNYYRPDLKKAALARLSVIGKGLRVAKSGPKRRNRQA